MGHFFRKFPPFQGVYVAVGPKKYGILPPVDHPLGENAALLGASWHTGPLKRGELPRIVFLEGGTLNPLQ